MHFRPTKFPVTFIGLILVICQCSWPILAHSAPGLTLVNDDNWASILEGEWMVEL